jgi:hypothetical protein
MSNRFISDQFEIEAGRAEERIPDDESTSADASGNQGKTFATLPKHIPTSYSIAKQRHVQ